MSVGVVAGSKVKGGGKVGRGSRVRSGSRVKGGSRVKVKGGVKVEGSRVKVKGGVDGNGDVQVKEGAKVEGGGKVEEVLLVGWKDGHGDGLAECGLESGLDSGLLEVGRRFGWLLDRLRVWEVLLKGAFRFEAAHIRGQLKEVDEGLLRRHIRVLDGLIEEGEGILGEFEGRGLVLDCGAEGETTALDLVGMWIDGLKDTRGSYLRYLDPVKREASEALLREVFGDGA